MARLDKGGRAASSALCDLEEKWPPPRQVATPVIKMLNCETCCKHSCPIVPQDRGGRGQGLMCVRTMADNCRTSRRIKPHADAKE
jgi:hypothetical protein